MVPLRDNNFKATMVLRSVLVLDRTYTQVKSRTFSSTNCALTVIIFMFIFMFIFFRKLWLRASLRKNL
jgi:hypothetical protein